MEEGKITPNGANKNRAYSLKKWCLMFYFFIEILKKWITGSFVKIGFKIPVCTVVTKKMSKKKTGIRDKTYKMESGAFPSPTVAKSAVTADCCRCESAPRSFHEKAFLSSGPRLLLMELMLE